MWDGSSITNSENVVIATAIVWDFTNSEVLLLTNYHTWNQDEFKYCFPPESKNSTPKRKRHTLDNEQGPVQLTLSSGEFKYKFVVTSEVFHSYEENEDFVVLKLPKD